MAIYNFKYTVFLFIAVVFITIAPSAHAQPCPRYLGDKPTATVAVKDFQFFFFPRRDTPQDPNIMLVEQNGQITDTQKVYYWNDDQSDEAQFYNKNIDISCSSGMDFISARYSTPEGRVYDYMNGECRSVDSKTHPLRCD